MTTASKTPKKAPAFYLYDTIETDEGKSYKRVGAAFPHTKGKGFTVIIDGKRLAAFPPKPASGAKGGAA